MKNLLRRCVVSAVALCTIAACSTIAPYDQTAYEKATSGKAEALALMDKATGDYSSNVKDIDAVTLDLNKAYEYDRGRAQNQITVQQWQILLSPDHDLYGGFLRDWKKKGHFKPVAIQEKKQQVGDGFDQIIQLESGKIKTPQAAH